MVAPRRRRRTQNRFLDNLGRISPSTMAMFGIAVLLLIASAGIVGLTVVRRSSATTADSIPTAEPTPFVAIVETEVPTPGIGDATPTPRFSPTRAAGTPATPQRTGTPRTTATTTASGPLGSGQSKGARSAAGSMAIALGGSLPPSQAAAAGPQPTAPAVIPGVPTPTRGNPTATRAPSGTGGGNTGGSNPTATRAPSGGNTGGGNPTATRTATRAATSTPTTAPTATRMPTATATPTTRPAPVVAFPGPGSKQYEYELTYTTPNFATAPSADESYVVAWETFTAVRVKQIAVGLGLTADPVATNDGFKVTDTKGDLIANNTSGSLRFTAKGSASVPQVAALMATPTPSPSAGPSAAPSAAPSVAPSAAPSAAPSPTATPTKVPTATPTKVPTALTPAQALEKARAVVGQATLLPDGVDAGRVTVPNPSTFVVVFRPASLTNIVSEPSITVTLNTDGTVREINHRWPKSINPAPTQLRTAQAAWEDALANNGYLEVDQTVPANSTTTFTGNATVTKISIGWGIANDGSTTTLQPVYVFEGTVALSNPAPGQTGPFPFRLYVQASR